MERIVLEVDEATAKAWRNSPRSLRESYQDRITEVLRELREKQFDKLLAKAGKIAQKNGLTEEKLNELLNEKD